MRRLRRGRPGAEPTEAAAIATLGLFALQHRGQESAGIAVSDGEQLMLYKDLGMISTVLDERRLPSLRGGWRSRTAATRRPDRRSGRTPSRPTARVRGARSRSATTAISSTRASCSGSSRRPRAAPGVHRHGAPDRAPRRRAGRRHGRGAPAGPAPRPRRVQPGHPRPAPGHRRPRPARVPAARPGAAAGDSAPAGRPDDGALCGRTTARTAGACRRRPPASTSSARSTCATWSPARSWSSSRAGSRARSATPSANPALCVFELIYFARPDSYMEGRNLYEARRRMGEQLAIEHPVEADLVMPVPDTGRAGRRRLRRGQRAALPRGHVPQPLRRPHIHPAVAGHAPPGRDDQAQPAARGRRAASG